MISNVKLTDGSHPIADQDVCAIDLYDSKQKLIKIFQNKLSRSKGARVDYWKKAGNQ